MDEVDKSKKQRQSSVTGAGEVTDIKGGLQKLKTVIFYFGEDLQVFQGLHTTQVSMSANQSNLLHTAPEHF